MLLLYNLENNYCFKALTGIKCYPYWIITVFVIFVRNVLWRNVFETWERTCYLRTDLCVKKTKNNIFVEVTEKNHRVCDAFNTKTQPNKEFAISPPTKWKHSPIISVKQWTVWHTVWFQTVHSCLYILRQGSEMK